MIKVLHSNNDLDGDFVLGDFGLESDSGLTTAVYLSLYLDARAGDDENDENDPRGWWAETFGYAIGSKLWTLHRAKTTARNIRLAEQFAKEALRWMLDDGIAREINVLASRDSTDRITIRIEIVRADGDRWAAQWDVQGQSLNVAGVVSSLR